jgi:hypothetical protein
MIVAGLLCLLPLRAEVTVFADGRARLPVIVAADAAPQERAAAEELARVLGVMSGLDWPVRPEHGAGAGFYIGRTRAAAHELVPLQPAADLLAPKADEIGPDGFRISTIGKRVYIEGATPEATANAVSWLLQREGGVRWYAPGALGEVIPRRAEWTLPELRVAREPAYVSREISGLNSPAAKDWARHNGLRQRIEYSHNLLNVFPLELGATHPEWFPLEQGRRVIPATKADYNWQPDLTRTEVVERAAQQAAVAFERDPGRASFSLGMNDSVRFDQGAATRAAVEPLRYFRGMPDYSPLVFGFMNRAAESLGLTHPDNYLGCLAYFWCENVPAFPVHSQVVPYVTTDRTQFYDAAYRADDYALMSRWGRSGVRAFGLWEYGYGNAYVVPRVPHAMLAEAVREGWWRGARGYIADTGPHWGFDAFKVWMLAQLLWEPQRTTAELKADFFGGWYGPAAEPMRRFFERCEEVWMAQPGPPWWIKYYRQQDQVLLYSPEVCRELRGMLAAAAAAANAEGGRLKAEGGRPTTEGAAGDRPKAEDGGRRVEDGGRNDQGRGAEANDQCPMTNAECRSRKAEGQRPLLPTPSRRQAAQICLSDGTQGVPLPGELSPETRNSKPEPPFAARLEGGPIGNRQSAIENRIALTSRAFAVTEAAVEFDRVRRSLGAAGETLSTAELAVELGRLQRARSELERAAQVATRTEGAEDRAGAAARTEGAEDHAGAAAKAGEGSRSSLASADVEAGEAGCVPLLRSRGYAADGTQPAMATGDVAYLLRNDPVPRLLAALGRRDPAAPLAVLAEVAKAGDEPMDSVVTVPAHWSDLAAACADGRLSRLKNRLTNGDFSRVAEGGKEPRFLYPRWGQLPAGWEVRGIATEAGRVALVSATGLAGAGRALRIEGAWESQCSTILAATPGRLHVVSARMRGQSSPGNDAALFIVFMTADGRITGEYRTQTLPKGASDWRTLLLAATAPADAAWVSVGVAALRQPAGDWLEAAQFELGAG